MLTLINGEKLIVRESSEEILEKILVYRAQLLAVMARKMPMLAERQRVVAFTSLDHAAMQGLGNEEVNVMIADAAGV
jgi:hypothetical protein